MCEEDDDAKSVGVADESVPRAAAIDVETALEEVCFVLKVMKEVTSIVLVMVEKVTDLEEDVADVDGAEDARDGVKIIVVEAVEGAAGPEPGSNPFFPPGPLTGVPEDFTAEVSVADPAS